MAGKLLPGLSLKQLTMTGLLHLIAAFTLSKLCSSFHRIYFYLIELAAARKER
jgi:hypothetical protein